MVNGIRSVAALIICLIKPICSVDKNLGNNIIEFTKPRTTPKYIINVDQKLCLIMIFI